MAYWGLAMVFADNPFGWPISLKLKEGAEAIQKAQDIGATTPRERDYIAALTVLYKDHETVPHRQRALAYEQAMEKLAATYPDDVEAKILSALIISANHDLNDKTFARPLKAALLEPLFAAYPQHPGVAHYLIHSYDYPPIAKARRRSAMLTLRPMRRTRTICLRTSSPAGFWRESVARIRRAWPLPKAMRCTRCMAGITWPMHTSRWPTMPRLRRLGLEALALAELNNVSFGAVFGVARFQPGWRWSAPLAEAATLALPANVSAEACSVLRRPNPLTLLPGRRARG